MYENINKTDTETQSLKWTSELVRKFWNYQSCFPENYFTSLYGDEVAKAVRKHVPRQARILDYACGTGALTGHLLRADFSVGGCDLSPDSIAYVRKVYGAHPSFKGTYTIEQLLAGSEKFDTVVLAELIEHVDDDVLVRVMSDVALLGSRRAGGAISRGQPAERSRGSGLMWVARGGVRCGRFT